MAFGHPPTESPKCPLASESEGILSQLERNRRQIGIAPWLVTSNLVVSGFLIFCKNQQYQIEVVNLML